MFKMLLMAKILNLIMVCYSNTSMLWISG